MSIKTPTLASASVPFRQIRAFYDDETITVYQAYSESIAAAAVELQKLNASPDFLMTRMTWIKPSWCWMMYRSGYAAKDARQTHILALKMTHKNFQRLLSMACVTSHDGTPLTSEQRQCPVRVQWDPERTPNLGALPYRSIQIGISTRQGVVEKWVNEWIEGIEDVTAKARDLGEVLEKEGKLSVQELIRRGLMPDERVYNLGEDLKEILEMDVRRD